eukprot:Tbor_TRINITY_DN5801_c4_g1::TRINITY_DN5801_c4_g1_i1::g.6583::m.6583/K02896/RP-L24e, RPL24; large subunit ribosomal protein L24e
MRIETCSFCGAPVYPGHGQMFVRNDCKTFRFCTSKCRKNFGMKRNPMRVKWTKTFRKASAKELAVDSTMAFERRRHIPVKYNRELVGTSLLAMQRVQAIKERRAEALWARRMAASDRQATREAVHALRHGLDSIPDAEAKQMAREDYNNISNIINEKKAKRKEATRAKVMKRKAAEREAVQEE